MDINHALAEFNKTKLDSLILREYDKYHVQYK